MGSNDRGSIVEACWLYTIAMSNGVAVACRGVCNGKEVAVKEQSGPANVERQ